LIARHKDFQDSSVPSGNAVAAVALLRLGKLYGRAEYLEAAHGTLQAALSLMEESPMAAGTLLIALDMRQGPFYEIAVVGPPREGDTDTLLRTLRQTYLPNCVTACRADPERAEGSPGGTDHLAPLFAGKTASAGTPTMYVCENFSCREPAVGLDAARAAVEKLAKGDADGT
jgi:uncharacterized protein YyaL (SSP411 family)